MWVILGGHLHHVKKRLSGTRTNCLQLMGKFFRVAYTESLSCELQAVQAYGRKPPVQTAQCSWLIGLPLTSFCWRLLGKNMICTDNRISELVACTRLKRQYFMVCRGDTDARDDDSDLGVNEDDLIFARCDPWHFLQIKPQQLKLTASSIIWRCAILCRGSDTAKIVARVLTSRAVQKVLLQLQETDLFVAHWFSEYCSQNPPMTGDKVGSAGSCTFACERMACIWLTLFLMTCAHHNLPIMAKWLEGSLAAVELHDPLCNLGRFMHCLCSLMRSVLHSLSWSCWNSGRCMLRTRSTGRTTTSARPCWQTAWWWPGRHWLVACPNLISRSTWPALTRRCTASTWRPAPTPQAPMLKLNAGGSSSHRWFRVTGSCCQIISF